MEFYHLIWRLGFELLLLLLATTSGNLLLFTPSQAPASLGLSGPSGFVAASTVGATQPQTQHISSQHPHYNHNYNHHYQQQQQHHNQQQAQHLIGSNSNMATPPIILTQPQETEVGVGSNVTLACSARGTPPLTFVWFQDEKNITGNVDSSSHNISDPPPSTKLLDERRYEIQEETNAPNQTTSILFLMNLKVTDTSVFLCWVENSAGSTISNFSLIVNDSLTTTHQYGPPRYLTPEGMFGRNGDNGGFVNSIFDTLETSNLQVTIVLVAFLLLLLITFICLFVLRQVTSSSRSSKSSQASQSSCAKNNTKLLAVEDLDGFFEHIRSGIIDIDHHSMSPAILFNNGQNPKDHQPPDHPHHQRQMTQMNHFQSASDVSSQQAFCDSQASSDASSQQQILYVAQPAPQLTLGSIQHQQQLQAPSLQPAFYGGQLSNSSSQQAFYVGQPAHPPLSNATSQQQQQHQAFYSCPPSNLTSHHLHQHHQNNNHLQQQQQQQQAFFGGQPPGDGQRTAHTLFI